MLFNSVKGDRERRVSRGVDADDALSNQSCVRTIRESSLSRKLHVFLIMTQWLWCLNLTKARAEHCDKREMLNQNESKALIYQNIDFDENKNHRASTAETSMNLTVE